MRKLFVQKYDAKRARICRFTLAKLTDAENLLFLCARKGKITRNMGTAIGAIRKAQRFLEKDLNEQEQNNDS